MREAQLRVDLQEVQRLARMSGTVFGERWGIPERPERYRPVPDHFEPFSTQEIREAFRPYLERTMKEKWWRIGEDPTKAKRPLREAASVLVGCIYAMRAGCDSREDLMILATDVADYLLWTQEQGNSGLFPFPASRGGNSEPLGAAARALRRAERSGRISEMLKNGWIVNDLGDGGLQFDNGVCGVAVLEFYAYPGKPKYLESAEFAAEWALRQPVVPNWNYNSFSVYLLAELAQVTAREDLIRSAVEKARLGVYPGQIVEGPHAGRWFDPHNARLAYHYILVRSLVSLAAACEEGTPERSQAIESLKLALEAHSESFTKKGIGNVDSAMEAHLLLEQRFSASDRSIKGKGRDVPMNALEAYSVSRFRRRSLPVSPGVWGRYLNHASTRLQQNGEE